MTSSSVPWLEERDATEGKAIANYGLDVNYKPERSGSEIKAVNEEEENFDTKYAKMELPQHRTLCQRTISSKVADRIEWLHWAKGHEIMFSLLQDMYLQLKFTSEAARLLVRQQGLDNIERLRVLTDKNVDGICNVMRKPGGKNADRKPNRGQQVSVVAQENLKLAVFLFHHWWRCTVD